MLPDDCTGQIIHVRAEGESRGEPNIFSRLPAAHGNISPYIRRPICRSFTLSHYSRTPRNAGRVRARMPEQGIIGWAGASVAYRGLSWDVVEALPAGAQTKLLLRCDQGDVRGLEWV